VGDEVMLRIRLPVDSLSSDPISVAEYRVRVTVPPRTNRSWPTPLDNTITFDPPHVFGVQDIPSLRWPFVVTEDMALEEGRVTVVVTIPALGLEGSTRMRVSPKR